MTTFHKMDFTNHTNLCTDTTEGEGQNQEPIGSFEDLEDPTISIASVPLYGTLAMLLLPPMASS